jgi:hypothetical protein
MQNVVDLVYSQLESAGTHVWPTSDAEVVEYYVDTIFAFLPGMMDLPYAQFQAWLQYGPDSTHNATTGIITTVSPPPIVTTIVDSSPLAVTTSVKITTVSPPPVVTTIFDSSPLAITATATSTPPSGTTIFDSSPLAITATSTPPSGTTIFDSSPLARATPTA